jgi:Domain of unknown function (DUF4920)
MNALSRSRVALLRHPLWSTGASLLLACAACESGAPTTPAASAPAAEPRAAAAPSGLSSNAAPAGNAAVARYGAALEPASTVPLASLLSDPKAYTAQTVTTEGKVQRACSRKGCWMEIGSGEDACRVTFKDYAFFVPTDSAGAFAKIQGRLDTREVEAAAVSHLESEGARFRNKKPDGSATEVRLIASAVELTR